MDGNQVAVCLTIYVNQNIWTLAWKWSFLKIFNQNEVEITGLWSFIWCF